ncbi:MAG: HEPN domain-containing protein [Bacteroidota bacterium]
MKKEFNTDILLWLDIALDDLHSSRILYENGKYRSSYFHFQQASEKANKAMAVMAGILSPEELADIQHDQLKIYRKSLVKQEAKVQEIKKIFEIFPKGNEHPFFEADTLATQTGALSLGIASIDSLSNRNLKDISLGELGGIVRQINTIKNTKVKLPKDLNKFLDTKFLDVANWMGQFPTQEAKIAEKEYIDFVKDKEASAEVYGYVTKIFSLSVEIGVIEMVLFYCAILTIKHSSATRYPQGSGNPLKEYSTKMPIIKRQPVFMDLLESAIEGLKRIHHLPNGKN